MCHPQLAPLQGGGLLGSGASGCVRRVDCVQTGKIYGRVKPSFSQVAQFSQVANLITRIYHIYCSVDITDWFPDQTLRKQVNLRENWAPLRYALKRMRKVAVMSTPEHIYCEQTITKELKHFTCMRQHASFQDPHHLYFLFDFMDGCDLMDALAGVATVQSIRHPKKPFAPKMKVGGFGFWVRV